MGNTPRWFHKRTHTLQNRTRQKYKHTPATGQHRTEKAGKDKPKLSTKDPDKTDTLQGKQARQADKWHSQKHKHRQNKPNGTVRKRSRQKSKTAGKTRRTRHGKQTLRTGNKHLTKRKPVWGNTGKFQKNIITGNTETENKARKKPTPQRFRQAKRQACLPKREADRQNKQAGKTEQTTAKKTESERFQARWSRQRQKGYKERKTDNGTRKNPNNTRKTSNSKRKYPFRTGQTKTREENIPTP